MHSLLVWTTYFLAALLFVGCAVAWWEHLGRAVRRSDEPDWESPLPKATRAVSVDIELDALTAPASAASDVGERRKALGGALTRMASGERRQGFGDTAPMVLPGPAAAAQPERRQRDSVGSAE